MCQIWNRGVNRYTATFPIVLLYGKLQTPATLKRCYRSSFSPVLNSYNVQDRCREVARCLTRSSKMVSGELGSSRGLSAGRSTTPAFTWREEDHENHQSGSRFESGTENWLPQLRYFFYFSQSLQGRPGRDHSRIVRHVSEVFPLDFIIVWML